MMETEPLYPIKCNWWLGEPGKNSTRERAERELTGKIDIISCDGGRKRGSSGAMHSLHRYEYGTGRSGQPSINVVFFRIQ
jgi:hypothetical protein